MKNILSLIVLGFTPLFGRAAPIESTLLQAVPKQGKFTEFHFPAGFNDRNTSCHSMEIDKKGVLWMNMSFENTVVSFDPATGEFARYNMPRTSQKNSLDAVTIDSRGNAWLGLYFAGALGRIDALTGGYSEYPNNAKGRGWGFNILGADQKDRIWGTSHQNRTVTVFDPATNTYPQFWQLTYEHPTALIVDVDGSVWVTGNRSPFRADKMNGGLARIRYENDQPEYFPIPMVGKDLIKNGTDAFWLAQSGKNILVTAFNKGLFLFDTETKTYREFHRSEGKENYFITRTSRDGRFAIGNPAGTTKTIDIFDPRDPRVLESYALPGKGAGAREAMAFDSSGNLWYCNLFTNSFYRLTL
jgi:streptogramin lyase